MLSQAGVWGKLSEKTGLGAAASFTSLVPLAQYFTTSNPEKKEGLHPHCQPLTLVVRAFEVSYVS